MLKLVGICHPLAGHSLCVQNLGVTVQLFVNNGIGSYFQAAVFRRPAKVIDEDRLGKLL